MSPFRPTRFWSEAVRTVGQHLGRIHNSSIHPPPPAWRAYTSIFELPRVKNCISKLCTNPLRDPHPRPRTQIGWKTRKYVLKHALHTLDGHFRWWHSYTARSPPPPSYLGGTGEEVRGGELGGGYGGGMGGGGTGDFAVHTQGVAHKGRCIHKAVHTKGGL